MAARRKREHTSFEDVVTDLRRARPIPALPDTVPFGQLPPTDPRLIAYPIAVRALRPAQARELVAEGAALAWDGCGCGAAQCLTWFGSSDRDRLVAGGKPVAEKGDLWLWSNADGNIAVIVESDPVGRPDGLTGLVRLASQPPTSHSGCLLHGPGVARWRSGTAPRPAMRRTRRRWRSHPLGSRP